MEMYVLAKNEEGKILFIKENVEEEYSSDQENYDTYWGMFDRIVDVKEAIASLVKNRDWAYTECNDVEVDRIEIEMKELEKEEEDLEMKLLKIEENSGYTYYGGLL